MSGPLDPEFEADGDPSAAGEEILEGKILPEDEETAFDEAPVQDEDDDDDPSTPEGCWKQITNALGCCVCVALIALVVCGIIYRFS